MEPAEVRALGDATFDTAVDTRRRLHAHPELGFEERATAALIRDRLGGLGLSQGEAGAETGVVFSLQGARPGRGVLLRADIDALPLHEEVSPPFRSEVDGVMHACGHDAHVAILLAAAEALAARAEELPGTYHFLFQPAEELLSGARRMIAGGVLEGIDVARMLGLHVSSALPTGLVALRAGIGMSRADMIEAHLTGSGGHGAQALAEGNVVLAVARLAARLPEVVDGMEYEWAACACSAGAVRAGTAANVIPREAHLRGTLRTYTEEQHADATTRLSAIVDEVAAEFAVGIDLQFPGTAPAVVNDTDAVEAFRRAAGGVVGAASVIEIPPVPQSDDVSEFLRRIPGAYYFVGARPGEGQPAQHHSPEFEIDEESIRVGTQTMVAGALALAGGG